MSPALCVLIWFSQEKNSSAESAGVFPKRFVRDGTLIYVVRSIWEKNWCGASSADQRKIEIFMLGLFSSVIAFPPDTPESDVCLSTVPELQEPLRYIGNLCASEPSWLEEYPILGRIALRKLLESMTMSELITLAGEAKVGIDCSIERKDELIQALLECGKPLSMEPMMDRRVC